MKVVKNNSVLNEAFSSSMPKWLKGYFVKLASPAWGKGSLTSKKKASYNEKGIKIPNNYPDVSNRAHGMDSWNLWRQLSEVRAGLGLRLDQAEFTPMTIPSKIDENTFSDSNRVYFLYFDIAGQQYVWCPGYNDQEFIYLPRKDGTMAKTTMGRLNGKNIRDYCVDACYIDLTNPANARGSRANLNLDRYNQRDQMDTSFVRGTPDTDYDVARSKKWGNQYRDKSGYIVNPHKYDSALKKLRMNKLPQTLEKIYNRLVDLRPLINSIYYDVDFDDSASLESIQDIISSYKNVLKSYKSNMISLDDALKTTDPYYKENRLNDIAGRYIPNLQKSLSEFEKKVGNIAPYLVNWDDIPEEED